MPAPAPDPKGVPVDPATSRRTPGLLQLLLLLGLVLRSVQYCAGVDFWYDELAVVRNVVDRDLGELLTKPLDHQQVAPAGFLFLLKVSTLLLGDGWAGFRLPGFLLGVLGLFLFWRVARRFASGAGLLAPLALFAVSPALVWYSASVKPYIGDVSISLLFCWLALRNLERPGDRGRALAGGLLGAAAMQVSFPAIPTAALVGLMLLVVSYRRAAGKWGPILTLVTCWAVGAAVATWSALARTDPDTDGFMRAFWVGGFPPTGEPLAWPGWAVSRIFQGFAHFLTSYSNPSVTGLRALIALPLVLALVGLFGAWRRRQAAALLLLVPPLAGLGVATLGILPFDHRLALHAGWPVLVLAGLGLTWTARTRSRRRRVLVQVTAWVTALPLTALVLTLGRPPYHFATGAGPGPSQVVADLGERYQAGDRIYAFIAGRHEMAYYGRRAGLEIGIQGARHPEDVRAYLREVDALRGAPRVWVFWSQLGIRPRESMGLILRYLGTVGRERQRIPADADANRIGAVLFDLSDPERLEAADAESFPVEDP